MTAPRPPKYYHHSGTHTLTRALPYLLGRVTDVDGVPDEALTPLEAAARAWRREAEADLGGNLAATARALLDAATGTVILLASLDRYVFQLAESGNLINRRERKAFSVLGDRMRLADSLARQLQALGLDRRAAPTITLTEYLAARERDGAAGGAPRGEAETPPDASPETTARVTHEEDDDHDPRGDADNDAH